jgi:Polyketide cyclase / dehydrase and lipid transport
LPPHDRIYDAHVACLSGQLASLEIFFAGNPTCSRQPIHQHGQVRHQHRTDTVSSVPMDYVVPAEASLHRCRTRIVLQKGHCVGSTHKEVTVGATPAKVWDAVRDFGAVHTRLATGFVTDTRLEGRDRVVTFAGGRVQREPLVDSNDDTRRLVYTAIDSVLGATHYNAAVQVFADASGGSRLVWLIDFLPDDIAPMLDLAMSRGVDAIRQTLERR